MSQLLPSRRSYDHRIREIVCQTGNPRIFQHLRIPRSTTASWLSRGRRSVVSLDWQHDMASVLDENERLKGRAQRQTAIIRLLVVLLKLSGFRLDEQRLPDGTAKAKVLRAVPPQNLVDRTIGDVSALGDNSWRLCSERHLTAQHIPQLRDGTVPGLPEARLGWGNRPGCRGPRECRHGKGTREARTETWASVWCCRSLSERWPTPTMRSWNQFSAFIEEWDELRMAT